MTVQVAMVAGLPADVTVAGFGAADAGAGDATSLSGLGEGRSGEGRSFTTLSAGGSPWSGADSARADAGRAIAQQITEAVRQSPGAGRLEVALQPEELGRLRLVFSPSDAGMTVTVHAERGDTMDLLRRHADLLADDLRDMGYASVDVAFGDAGQGSDADDPGRNRDGANTPGADNELEPHAADRGPAPRASDTAMNPSSRSETGLDLRL
ncbi:MAG: flagellar hook-length control protein FliK [Pseudomonadota bacterium]